MMEVEEQSLEQFKAQTRLPKFAIPKRYDLTLTPDLSACTFSGTVLIDLEIVQSTKFLVLNALELAITQVSFTDSHDRVSILQIRFPNFYSHACSIVLQFS